MNRVIQAASRGVTAVEVVIGVSIAALILVFTTHTIVRFVNVGSEVTDRAQALYLAEEGVEMVRFLRDEDWTNISGLANNTPYYLSVAAQVIAVSGTLETIDGRFTRWFEVDDVYRHNTTDSIIASTTPGAVADSNSKYVTFYVAWNTPTTTLQLTSIIADIHE